MSTILKALRRLEEERSARSARALRDEVVSPGRATPARSGAVPRSRRAWLQGAAGGAALAALAWAFWPGAEAPSSAPTAPPAVASAPPVEPETPARPLTPPAVATPPPSGSALAPAEEDEPVTAPVAVAPPAPTRIAVPRAAAESERERMRAAERQRAEAEAEPAPPPAEEASPPVAIVPPRRGPEITVARTVWHPAPERRIAIVEPAGGARRTVREGDTVGDARVVRIEPSGVVFERAGVERLRKIGEAP